MGLTSLFQEFKTLEVPRFFATLDSNNSGNLGNDESCNEDRHDFEDMVDAVK